MPLPALRDRDHPSTTAASEDPIVSSPLPPSGTDGAADGRVDGTYAQVLDELTRVVVDTPATQDVLDQLIGLLHDAIPDLTAVSVTVVEDGAFRTAASTGPKARQVDEHEYHTEQGPCIDALRTGRVQIAEDVLADDRWPGFSEAAARVGFRSVAGLPLPADDRTVGALNLYAAEPGRLHDALPLADRLTGPLGTIVANAIAYASARRLGDDLQRELADLASIEQAVGVLMATRRCDADTAASLLRQAAEATGRSVDEVAEAIVADARRGRRPGGRRP
jgi:GAF domain-containing protein